MIFEAGVWKPSFTPEWIREKGNGTGKVFILNRWMSLDTETSHNHKEGEELVGWIYQWCFKIHNDVVIGRTPAQLIAALKSMEESLGMDSEHKCVIYIHNASYDFQYLKNFFRATWGQLDILAVSPHKIISVKCGPWIIKCSWKLANKSLDTWTRDLGTEHRKLVGTVDYDVIRYQDTDLGGLDSDDWRYMINDVLSMDEALEKQLAMYGDTISTVPLTTTGYIRRTARANYRKENKNRKGFISTRLTARTYKALLREFAGGLTHGNRFYTSETVDVNDYEEFDSIRHFDFVSHYPSQQRTRYFPIGRFFLYAESGDIDKVKRIKDEGYCVLFDLSLYNPRIKSNDVIMPIISESKARQGMLCKSHFISDNGRVLKCDGAFTITVTDLDMEWILKQYTFDAYQIGNIYSSKRGMLPPFMIETVDNYMYGKTAFKEEVKRAKDKETKEYYQMELLKSKNGLNGIYGCTAQRPVRPEIKMDEAGNWEVIEKSDEELEAELDKYYSNRNNFMRYQWGCWTTSWARHELLEFCEIIQKAGGVPLYCDTDSIFFLSNEKVMAAINEKNERLKAQSEALGAYIDFECKRVYYNQFADEEEDIRKFRFLHAKCYAYEEGGELHVTVAGVPAYEDGTHKFSRIEELGSIDNLDQGFTFTRCGGTTSKYTEAVPDLMEIDGHMVEYASACIIEKTTKTLNNMYNIYNVVTEMEVE